MPIQAREVSEPFHCEGRQFPVAPSPVIPAYQGKPGRLEIVRTDPRARPPDGGAPEEGLLHRYGVVAENVTLSAFAVRLAEVSGTSTTVDGDLSSMPVTLIAQNQPLQAILSEIQKANPLHAMFDTHPTPTIRYLSYQRHRARYLGYSREELVVQIVPVNKPAIVRELASALCHQLITDRGSISVVGDALLVQDVGSNLGRVRAAVGAIAQHPSRDAGFPETN